MTLRRRPHAQRFRELLETLRQEMLDFPGQVMLVHGDTHSQHIDQPLRHPETKRPVANFTRIETFGYPFMGWVKVIIDDEDSKRFRVEVHPPPARKESKRRPLFPGVKRIRSGPPQAPAGGRR